MSQFGNCRTGEEHLIMEEFCRKFNHRDANSVQQHRLQLLKDIYEALVKNDIHRFKELCQLVNSEVNKLSSRETLLMNYNFIDNPFRGSNIIIIACRENKSDILKHIFQNEPIFKNFASISGKNILASDEDMEHHTAFYYAIRSGSVELTETLVNKWPGGYLPHQLSFLLSTAYEELKLKNIQISEQVISFIENKLVNIRFWTDEKNISHFSKNDIIERSKFLLENIRFLLNKYSENEVDEIFLLTIKYIAQNVHILKGQLKICYDTIPWEEMEFCLITFINSVRQHDDKQFINCVVLNKKKLLLHLEIFAKYLHGETNRIQNSSIRKLQEMPQVKRDEIVTVILKNSPEFKNLYSDYEKIRDHHSLEIMNQYIEMALSADCTTSVGQLVIIRTLQVLGENLKNTLQSPRLSPSTSELLVCSLTRNTRKILLQLRDNLSHVYSLLRRVNIERNESNFFNNTQNDIKKLNPIINDILFRNKISIIRMLLEIICNSNNAEELKHIIEPFSNFDFKDLCILKSKAKTEDLFKIRGLISELNIVVKDKTNFEKELMNKLNQVIKNGCSDAKNQEIDYFQGFCFLKNWNAIMKYSVFDKNCMRVMKYSAKQVLEFFKSEINVEISSQLIQLSKKFATSVLRRLDQEVSCEVKCIVYKVIMILGSKCDVEWLEEFHYNITRNKDSCVSNENYSEKSEFDFELSHKISILKELLPIGFSQNKTLHEILHTRNNRNLIAAVEMLLLDILAILEEKKKCLSDNKLFLDEHCPTLLGKNLRNHLAHDNPITKTLYCDYLRTLLFNANILCSNNFESNKRRIGKIVCSNIAKLQTKCDQYMKIIKNQQKMFSALEEGNLDIVKGLIENGADIKARSLDMSTALHHAAKGSSIECAKFVIEQGVIIDLKNINGKNALHIATTYGQKNIISFFIRECSMNANDSDNSGRTCLHFASQKGFRDIVLLLLKNGAKFEKRDINCLSPLHYAVLNNRANIVEVLLDKLDVHHETLGGYTLLHLASENGFLDVVKLLLRKKANVNARNDNFGIPLHTAALNGHLDVVKTLISEGSNVSDQNIQGCTPLHHAVENGHKQIVEILLDHSPEINLTENSFNRTALSYAAEDGFTEIVELLLQHGALVDIASVEGNTALHFAALKGRMKILDLLVRYGAHINFYDKRGCTALHLSSQNGHSNVVQYLLEKGGNVNAFNLMNETPLHYAVTNTDVIKVLLQNGADKNIQNCVGDTPLHIFCGLGLTKHIQIFIKEGADLFIKNECDMTPLHLAVNSGVWEAVETLIAAGADTKFSNFMGLTMLHHAAIHGHENVVQGLIKNYNNVNVKNEDGLIPLHFAVMGNHAEVVKILIENGSEINAVAISRGEHSTQFPSIHNLKQTFMKLMDENAVNTICDSVPIPQCFNYSMVSGKHSTNNNCSPLHIAVCNNNIDIVSLLLSKGADVNAQQCVSIAFAILAGFKDIAEMLIKNKNFKVNESYLKDVSLLHLAATKGHNTMAESLLMKGANVNSQSCSYFNMTPLHLASEKGYSETVKILIAYGADVNKQADDGTTPLHRAAVAGHEKIVHILLLNKAKKNIRDLKFRTPLVQAVAYGHQKIVETLLDCSEINMNHSGQHDFTLLHIAAQEGNIELTKYLTNKGADIHCTNNVGSKPIHIAARDGHKHIVEYFLNKNMSIDVTGIGGASLLHYAAHGQQVEVTQFLLENKANPNKPNMLGSTPIHIASKCGAKEVVQILLNNGAFYNPLDLQHHNPLEYASTGEIRNLLKTCDELFEAVKNNNPLEVELCLKKCVVANIKNKSNETPLLYAAWKGYEKIIDVLLRNKANPNVRGKKGSSPLHYACKFSHVSIVKILLSNGAIYNLKNDSQKTPLNFAENEEIINLLKFVDESFRNVQNGNGKVISDLEKLIDPKVIKIFLNVRNLRNQTLLVCAVHNDFPKVKKLKKALEGDISTKMFLAEALCSGERYQEAQQILEEELEKKNLIYDSGNPSSFDAQILIAKTYYKQQHYEKALNIFQDAYEKQIKLFGVKNVDVQRARCGVGLVLHRQGKNKEALAIFREVLQIQNELLGPNDNDILHTQANMALALVELGQNEEALSVNNDILKKMKKSFGSNDPRTLSVMNNIAMILNNLDKWEDSLKMYKLVYEKRKIVLGQGHSDTLRTWYNTSSVLLSQERDKEALDILRQVVIIQRQELKPDHPDTINTIFTIGSIFFQQGKFLLALNFLKHSHEMKLRLLGPAHPQVVHIAEIINCIYGKFSLQGYSSSMILQQAENQIQVAASSGDKSTVEICVNCGTDVNFMDCNGRTALHCAAANGHKEIVITLVDKGADCLLASSGKGNTALHFAAAKGYKDITEILLMHVKKFKSAKLKHFVNAGTLVLCNTALHVASNIATVKTLLKYGACYDIKNKKGETPLDGTKSQDIADFLHLIHELFHDAKVGKLELISKVRNMTQYELIVLANTQNKDYMTIVQVAKSNRNQRLSSDLLTILKEKKCFDLT